MRAPKGTRYDAECLYCHVIFSRTVRGRKFCSSACSLKRLNDDYHSLVDEQSVRQAVAKAGTQRGAARLLGVSAHTVFYWCKKIGVVGTQKRGAKLTISQTSECRKMYESGQSSFKIAKRMGVSQAYIYNTLKRLGVSMRQAGRGHNKNCTHAGCVRPAYKFPIMGGRWMAGNKCRFHHRRHQALFMRWKWRFRNGLTVEQCKRWKYLSEVPGDIKSQPDFQEFLHVHGEQEAINQARALVKEMRKLIARAERKELQRK